MSNSPIWPYSSAEGKENFESLSKVDANKYQSSLWILDGQPNNAEVECLKMGLPLAEVTGDEAVALQESIFFSLYVV